MMLGVLGQKQASQLIEEPCMQARGEQFSAGAKANTQGRAHVWGL